jgi:hypothetical protein
VKITRTSDTAITITSRGKRTRFTVDADGMIAHKGPTASINTLALMHNAGAITDAEMERAVRRNIAARNLPVYAIQSTITDTIGTSGAAKIVRRTCASILDACAV